MPTLLRGPVVLAFVLSAALMVFSASALAKDATKKANEDKKGATPVTASKNPHVILETNMGNIEVELDGEKAPISTENFLKYVDNGHYSGTIFHRVIDGFMIQGGGFTEDMKQKSTLAPIKNEAQNGLKNLKGTLAMARTNVVDSATAQFFINVVDNAFLDHKSPTPSGFGYAVFGKVVGGMDVVEKMKGVATASKGMHENVPVTPIVIKTAKRK
jgi:peptidyl-prolyl cis-trans isomerase A (cyclophilin A)